MFLLFLPKCLNLTPGMDEQQPIIVKSLLKCRLL
uniref:Uncharacterized protein n=1 Tax=Microplitis mediator bracovirus TaxID=1836595 RepID=A0A2I6SGU8_9VIRU|nr:hypothetical protein MmBV_CAP1 [Microplitis mediator bracovirus]